MERPKAGSAVGIINIIFTGFGILGGVLSLGTFSILKTVLTKVGQEFLFEYEMLMSSLATFFTLIMLIALIRLAISALGLAGGIGLLKKKHWSILLCNIYAIGTIAVVIINFIVSRQIMIGIFENPMIVSSIPPDQRFALEIVKAIVPGFAGVIGILFGSAYPVLVLILLNRPKVRDFYIDQKEEE